MKKKNTVTFDDLPKLRAVESSIGKGCFKIYKQKEYIAFYSEKAQTMFLIDTKVPDLLDCNSLHQAMRFSFLKTQNVIQ